VVRPLLIAALLLAPTLARHGESGFSSPHAETGTRADRTQVYSVQGVDCASCADAIKAQLKKVEGIRKVDFDKHAVELRIRMADGVSDQVVLDAVARAEKGFTAVVGAGQGAYLPVPEFPPGTDVQVLTRDGSAVGPLPNLAVPGRYTVFDVFAEWCGPCREVDERLRQVVSQRTDVAIRKLNVRDFDTPLALELGPMFETLPYVVVITPKGKRFDVVGTDFEALDKALQTP
jgi:copper chaperone CopZ/thiol-disulfide isomerase/thioredoxin